MFANNLWFFCALGTSILWGLGYAVSDKIMRDSFHPLFLMVVTGFLYLGFSLIAAYFSNNLKEGVQQIMNDPMSLAGLLTNAVCIVLGSFLIYYAINLKNATAVNPIEMTYPVFTLIFAYILMREVQLNGAIFAGGILVFAGVALIYLKG